MAAKKKRTKAELRALVASMRQKYAPETSNSVAELAQRAREIVAAYEAEGLGALLAKDQPLQRCLSQRGTVVGFAGSKATPAEIDALEKEYGTKLPNAVRALVEGGGLLAFHRDPQQEIRTFSPPQMIERRAALVGLLGRPPKERGTIDGTVESWRYGVSSGSLPPELREGANLLPLAPYYGDHGVYFAALHIKGRGGESPVFCAELEHGDVTFYAHDAAAWTAFMARLAFQEIDWAITA
jgi:hypothetical protein